MLPGSKVILSRQKKFKQLLKQINSPKCTKERQCLTLFGTEMVFSQKAVSDLHWKNVGRTKKAQQNSWDKKCPLELRFLKVVDSAKLLGTPLHTWGYVYRHLFMTHDASGNICFSSINWTTFIDLYIHMFHIYKEEHLNLEAGKY